MTTVKSMRSMVASMGTRAGGRERTEVGPRGRRWDQETGKERHPHVKRSGLLMPITEEKVTHDLVASA